MKSLHQEYLKIADEETSLEMFVAHPQNLAVNTPAVLIFPTWSGRDTFCHQKALTVANLGYIGIAIDLYGEGRIGKTPEECQRLITPFLEDRSHLKRRLEKIIRVIGSESRFASNDIVAIGYCFGGLCVLDAVRNNLGLKAGISVHGLLNKPVYQLPKQYASKVLAIHGYQDPMVTPQQALDFQNEMLAASVDLQFMSYSIGIHAFTNPEANEPESGRLYNPLLDRRSTELVHNFLNEVIPI